MSGQRIPVIDLFAGPGGLGEGFSSIRNADGDRVFQTIMSIEMEDNAHATLRLRAFFRRIFDAKGVIPAEYLGYMAHHDAVHLAALQQDFPEEWAAADKEAVQGTLVIDDYSFAEEANKRLAEYKKGNPNLPTVIIGGPPCQAYSLVGRSRRAHDETLQTDVKQTLYVCYLQFVKTVRPDIFVMENVKGLLSAKLHEEHVLSLIRQDVKELGYTLHSLEVENPLKPGDFIVHSERHGVPQARHRIILVGIRDDTGIKEIQTLRNYPMTTVSEALVGLPRLRSSFSKRARNETDMQWSDYVLDAARRLSVALMEPAKGSGMPSISRVARNEMVHRLRDLTKQALPKYDLATHLDTQAFRSATDNPLRQWYRSRLEQVDSDLLTSDHVRSHMASDLDRYLFSSVFSAVTGRPAKLADFPAKLLPNHKNIQGKNLKQVEFNDRFRTQLGDRPSTTVTSHISKDGHYFIHPDYTQVRSLTVREAARLQTFPDDYVFEGNRTSQYQQVGNAVPPLLANQIAVCIAAAFGRKSENYFTAIMHEDEKGKSSESPAFRVQPDCVAFPV